MAYELYPAVDPNFDFPPEVRARLAISIELRNTVIPMSESTRNNLTVGELWDGRLVFNTTTKRINRYTLGTTSWSVLMEQADVDTAIVTATPIGAIMAYAGPDAPLGWHLCNGSIHSSAALETVLTLGGHANPHLTPDLRDRFILGDGGSQPVSGGAATVTLSAVESGVRAHTHPTATTGNENSNHYHGVDPPNSLTAATDTNHLHGISIGGSGHGHNSAYGNNWQGSTQDQNPAGTDYAPIGNAPAQVGQTTTDGWHNHSAGSDWMDRNASHQHYVDIGPFNSGTVSAYHTHNFTPTSNTDGPATAAHQNMPPFYTLTYIIKTV
jgi:microcystin-dependent protein